MSCCSALFSTACQRGAVFVRLRQRRRAYRMARLARQTADGKPPRIAGAPDCEEIFRWVRLNVWPRPGRDGHGTSCATVQNAAPTNLETSYGPRHADGRVHAPLLAARMPVAGTDRRAQGDPDPARGSGGIQGPPGQRRRAAPQVRPPRGLARVRHRAGTRDPLLLPRLALRRRRQTAGGAGGTPTPS